MSAAFSIQQPVVIANLPRPVIQPTGRYVVSNVYGGVAGLRKKKRAELVVGIDGEGVNIYNTRSAKLSTSYALPPQSSLTCPPCSLRLRKSNKRETERRTYVSTKERSSNIVLFKEATVDGTAESKITTRVLEGSKVVVFLSTVSEGRHGASDDLLVVRQDGEILCLQGDTLETRWTSPATTISRGTDIPEALHKVEFAKLTDAHTASKGLLKGHTDALAAFPEPISADSFNPAILVIITSPTDADLSSDRTLHVVTVPRETQNLAMDRVQSVQTLLTMALPWLHRKKSQAIGDVLYNLNVASGVVHELSNGWLTTFTLSESLPRIQSQFFADAASSFMPLSSTSIITSSEQSVSVYHPTFRSIQASIDVSSTSEPAFKKRRTDGESNRTNSESYRLVAYSPKQGIVYAIKGSGLAVFQIETGNDISSRKGAQGLLINSLEHGFVQPQDSTRVKDVPLLTVRGYRREHNVSEDRTKGVASLDQCVAENDVEAFECIMAKVLHLKRDERELDAWKENHIVNGVSAAMANGASKPIPPWLWPIKKADYPEVEPFWVQYVIRKIFSWSCDQSTNEGDSTTPGECRLLIVFFPHNVVNWLIETGNLNKATIELALQNQVLATGSIPAGQFIQAIADVNPEMKMLLSLLSSTFLDAPELLHAIKILMQSLELFGGSLLEEKRLLTNGEGLVNGDLETEIELEEEEADKALQVAEYHLGDGSSIRGQSLSIALVKLHARPRASVILALQTTWTLNEIISLIYLLRFELARGSWTSRYLDTDPSQEEAVQDNAIVLLADLLNSCIDAIGAGGWLSSDAMLVRGDQFESEELIASLKLEVSAALEGIEEATYLKGLTTEITRYGEFVQKSLPKKKTETDKRKKDIRPITLSQGGENVMLPMGLKTVQQVSLQRVGAGGEVYARSMRDIGRLKNRKVGKYSRERIVI